MNVTVLVFSHIVIEVSFVNISISISVVSMTLFLSLNKVSFIVISTLMISQSTISMEYSINKVSLIFKNYSSIFSILKMAFAIINTFFKTTFIDSSIFILSFTITIKLIILEISLITSSILSY